MKRIISFIICLALCASSILVSAADSASLAEKVLTIVRPRIPDTSAYSDFTSSVSTENGRTIYHFNWSDSSSDDYKGMYLGALENGIITSFGINEGKPSNEGTASGFDRISISEALRRTKELLKILNPDIADKLSLKPSTEVEQFDAKNLTFSITHTESGIPVFGDKGRVTVDINAEKITGFSLTFTDNLTYPSPVNIIDLATAKKVFAEEIGVDLFYKVWQDNAKKTIKIFPVYSPRSDNLYVNANTGTAEIITPFTENVYIKNESADSMAGGGNSLGLTPAELKEIENLKKLLSKNAAEERVRAIKLLSIDDDYTLEEFSTRRLSNIEELYGHSLVFCRITDERVSYIFVDINAETGEVLSYSNFGAGNDTEVTDEQKTAFCDEVLEVLAPHKHTEYWMRPIDGDMGHYIVYDRYVNGARVDGNTISIELNADNSLASYRISYTNADFPIYFDIISNSLASDSLFDKAGYSLVYIPQKSDSNLKRPDKAVLIYDLDDYNVLLDPYTGNRINSDGTDYVSENNTGEYIDISGHYAEDKIKALQRFGIGFDSNEFKPESACLQKDFITLLANAFGAKPGILIGAGINIDDFYKQAQILGIIKLDEISPELPITRLQAAKFICRALKIEKYAQLDKIFNCPFRDVSAGKGYVTMLWGMGIVNGTSKNYFSPDDNLSRGQSAILLYNALNNQ